MGGLRGTRWVRFLVLVLSLAGLAACTTAPSGDEAEEPAATAVETAPIRRGNIEAVLELAGTVRAQQARNPLELLEPAAGPQVREYVAVERGPVCHRAV